MVNRDNGKGMPLKLITFLLFVIVTPLITTAQLDFKVEINSGDPAYPFPQFLDYPGCPTLGRNHAAGVTDCEMEQTIRDAYIIMMNRAEVHAPETTIDNNGNPFPLLKFNFHNKPDNYGTFVSEGDGYALLAAAYMADQKTFNGLWAWVHDNRLSGIVRYQDCRSLRPGYLWGKGLAGWDNDENTGEGSTSNDAATDGDFDIALALLIAARQWPGQGITDNCGTFHTYRNIAADYINAMVDTVLRDDNSGGDPAKGCVSGNCGYLSGDVGFDGYIKNGNTWKELTDWAYTEGGWQLADVVRGNTTTHVDYYAPAYCHAFSAFTKEFPATPERAWRISQWDRAEASSDWLMGELDRQGLIPVVGNVSVNTDGSGVSFSNFNAGEDFRAPWRTILNYVWHGNPTTSWDPVNHSLTNNGNSYEFDLAVRFAAWLKQEDNCQQLGSDPTDIRFSGEATLRNQYDPGGAPMTNFYLNWLPGTGMPSAVAAGDLDLLTKLYRQCELEWDPSNASPATEDERYIESLPKYFHGWFRMLGMLVATGNLHSPEFLKQAPKANLKIYMRVDKTFAFENDLVTYTLDYRNYASVDANGVSISFPVPAGYEFVSATGGGSVSGGSVVWNTGRVPGFKTSTGVNLTTGQLKVTFKIKGNSGRICARAIITASNGYAAHTSDEYPNNCTPVMERNCVDILSNRALNIKKTASQDQMNPGDTVAFTLKFENSTEAGWLNGGRPGVRFTYANGFAGPNSFIQYFRILHGADEAYINYSNYRASYFLNEPGASDISDWKFGVNIAEGFDPSTVNVTFEKIPFGSDTMGDWDQRMIIRFADDMAATAQHLYNYFGPSNVHRIHKGVTEPFRMRIDLETVPSLPMGPKVADDWSYDLNVDVGSNDKSAFIPIGPKFRDAENITGIPVNKVHIEECRTTTQFERILIEEWDGYTWRRVYGTGPLPGREMNNVVVHDTLPPQLSWGGFMVDETLGIKATYDPATRIIEWTIPAMLVGSKGLIQYKGIASGTCPNPDINFSNKAWIWSDTESPVSSETALTVTCKKVNICPASTSMTKAVSPTMHEEGDSVTYTIDFTQSLGSIAHPDLNSNTDWTAHSGSVLPEMSNGQIMLGWTSDSPSFFTHDYSHGYDGDLEISIEHDNWADFTLAFRHQSGAPLDPAGVYLRVKPNPNGNGTVALEVFNGSNAFINCNCTYIDQPSCATPFRCMDITVRLQGDSMYVWINVPKTGPPTWKVEGGIQNTQPGYAGFYNSHPAGSPNNGSHIITRWWSHFDSGFEVAVKDEVPEGIINPAGISNGGNLSNGVITWLLSSGKMPMIAGENVQLTWKGIVDTCADIFNAAYVSSRGISEESYGACVSSACGTKPACTLPGIVVLSAEGIQCDWPVLLTATASANGDFQYEFFYDDGSGFQSVQGPGAATTYNATGNGTYYVIVSDPADPISCGAQSNTVQLNPGGGPATPADAGDDRRLCAGDTTSLGVANSDGAGYTWSPKDGLLNPGSSVTFASPSVTTTYILTKTAGCNTTTDTVVVVADPVPDVDAKPERAGLKKGASIQLKTTASSSGLIYQWSPPEGLSCTDCTNPVASPENSVTYTVEVINSYNCSAEDYVIIDIDNDPGPGPGPNPGKEFTLFIPNTFTPNGDGVNDRIKAEGFGIQRLIAFRIFDRWGELIFESSDLNQAWDGTFKGEPLDTDRYVYYVIVEDYAGRQVTRHGSITLVR